MHYSVEGYLVISDDMFLVAPRLTNLSKHMMWFPNNGTQIDVKEKKARWVWFPVFKGRLSVTLKKLHSKNNRTHAMQKCSERLFRKTGSKTAAYSMAADIF